MKTLTSAIKNFYLLLFLVTPLIFTFSNSELFELPKMYFVYLVSVIIFTLHIINWIRGNIPLFQKHFALIPIIIFLISQIICTFTSIDIHTSFFGYSSRLNGGLLSILVFTLIYCFLIPYINDKFTQKIIDLSLLSGLFVSIYGIAQHFGIDKNIWVQDVQSRVFSTLGQPNWLAAYLCILLPFSIYKILKSTNKSSTISYLLLTSSYYLALLFTKSKSGIIAGIISISIFFLTYFIRNQLLQKNKRGFVLIFILIILSLSITNPIKEKIFSKQLKIENSKIENLNITPSGDIRKIVWKGSLALFKEFPLVGTGVETFAYSYYWTRPVEHNLTSEWDFLYNKAHNEYLNYLATTGLVGTIPYLVLIFTVLIVLIKKILNTKYQILNTAILSSFTSILITNAAGFSVVVVSLYFFLLPALVENNSSVNTKTKPLRFSKISILVTLFISLSLIQNIFSAYIADVFFAKSTASDNQQNYQLAFSQITQSLDLSPNNPDYLITHSLAAAKMAVITKDENYINQATNSAEKATSISPANINFWKQKAQVYFYLSSLNKEYFIKTAESMLQAAKLAPTDAKIYFSLGQFLESTSLPDDAAFYYQKAIDLKSNYDHAYFALGKIYFDQKKYNLAKINLEQTLKYAPTNTDAQKLLDELKNQN